MISKVTTPKVSKTLGIRRSQDPTLIFQNIRVAWSVWERMRGLLHVSSLEPRSGLLIPGCSSIQMWGMRISLDVVFLKRIGREWEVISLYQKVRPWRLLPLQSWKADDVLELAEGTIEQTELKIGERLCIA